MSARNKDPDEVVTKKELGSWARLAFTVIPIMVTVLATTWALGSQSKATEEKISALEKAQLLHTDTLAKHARVVDRVPQLEDALERVSAQLKDHEKWTRRLNDTLIRVETLLTVKGEK